MYNVLLWLLFLLRHKIAAPELWRRQTTKERVWQRYQTFLWKTRVEIRNKLSRFPSLLTL